MINRFNFKEMKKQLTVLLAFGLVSVGMAQPQNPECMTNLSIFSEHAKVKNYDAAYEPWKMVFDNCPELHAATYLYGERIVKHKIDKSNGADRATNVKLLINVLDGGLKYFPSKYTAGGVAVDKALLMYDEKMASDEEVYNMLGKAFKEDRENFKNPKALYLYFSLLVDLQGQGKKDLQDVFDTYDEVSAKIAEENKALAQIVTDLLPKEEAGTLSGKEQSQLNAARVNGESYETISGSIDAKLGNLADCTNLIPLYQKNFDSKKQDALWLERALSRMDEKDCTGDPMYVKIVEALHNLRPSAESAYGLGTLNDKQSKSSEAIKYYNEAVDLQTDPYKKSQLLLKIASKYAKAGSKSTARNYAQKAIDVYGANGNAYLLIANLYGNSANECGSDAFEKRSIYWKAADMARRAAQVDPSVKGRALAAADSYAQRAPSKTDIFQSGKAGQTITFSCWVGGSVKVPNL